MEAVAEVLTEVAERVVDDLETMMEWAEELLMLVEEMQVETRMEDLQEVRVEAVAEAVAATEEMEIDIVGTVVTEQVATDMDLEEEMMDLEEEMI